MKRVMVLLGTRPEAIKLCPVIRELKKRDAFSIQVCSTGQHREMLDSALAAFDVKADFDLDCMRMGQTSSTLASRILKGFDEILESEAPELVLVHGDTTTTFAAALAAFYRGVPIAHVEAGLRTYNIL